MARVDKKPTYINTVKSTVASWCLAHHDPNLCNRMGIFDEDVSRDLRDDLDIKFCTNSHTDNMLNVTDPVAIMMANKVTWRTTDYRAKVAREWLSTIMETHDKCYWGSDASVFLAKHMLRPDIHNIQRMRWNRMVNAINDILVIVAQDFKVDPDALIAARENVMSDMLARRSVCIAENTRLFLGMAANRSSFLEQLCITQNSKFADIFDQVKSKDPRDRFLCNVDASESYKLKQWSVCGIKVFSCEGNLLFLDHEACEKARRIVQSVASTHLWKAFDCGRRKINGANRLTADATLAIMNTILADACKMVETNKCYSVISKSMKTMFLATIQGHKEGNAMFDEYAVNRTELLVETATGLWPTIKKINNRVVMLGDEDKLEVYKLANILPAVDSDPESMKKRLAEETKRKQTVDKDEWKSFMDFVKIYDIATYACNKRAMPNTEGDAIDPVIVESWMEGKFVLPERSVWGNTYMVNCYDQLSDVNEYWMDAKDVTWVGENHGVDTQIDNELKVSWEYGPNIDKERSAIDAIRNDMRSGTVAYWAPKAENHKSSNNQRLTASASAGARAVMSLGEQAQRVNSGNTPGFGQGLDAIRMGAKVQSMLTHMARDPGCFISSHDIKGWSEFEDRTAKNEYIKYECNKYTDPILKSAGDAWDKIVSVLVKAGVKWSGPFENGGIQGWNGVLDSIMHAKIVAYVHQKAHGDHTVRSAAQLLVCIDDVAYDVSIRGKMDKEKVDRILGSMKETYDKLAYYIDDTKSIHGKKKMVFLSDTYLDAMYVSTPLKVAIKADTDMRSKVKTAQDDWSSWMSTASAVAVNGGDAISSYLFGTTLALYNLMSRHKVVEHAKSSCVAAWLLMPVSEGGMGHPSLRVFCCGADSDPSFAWRDMITQCDSVEARQAMCSLSGYLLEVNNTAQTLSNPMQIRHSTKPSGSVTRRSAISHAMSRTRHHKVWDDLKEAGEDAINLLAKSFNEGFASVDMISMYDVSSNLPNTLYEDLIDKFSSTGAISSILSRRDVWKIARTCARADKRWIDDMMMAAQIDTIPIFDDAWSEMRDLRASLNPGVILINSVIPTTSSATCVSGLGSTEKVDSMESDYIMVRRGDMRLPRNRTREDQISAKKGRRPGFRSEGGCWTEVGKALKKSKVGQKLVQVAAVLRTLAYRGIDVFVISEAFSRAWGLDYLVHEVRVCPEQIHPKRVCSLTSKTTHMALAYRNVYSAPHCRTDALYKFVKDECGSSLVDPMAVSHMMKLSILMASINHGLTDFSDICWELQPSARIDWAYTITDTMFAGVDIKFTEFDRRIAGITVPDKEDLEHLMSRSDVAQVVIQGFSKAIHTEVSKNTVLFKASCSTPKVMHSGRTISYKAVPRGLVTNYSTCAGMVDAIIRFRVSEACKNNNLAIENIIWEDLDHDAKDECKFLSKEKLWETIMSDCRSMVSRPEMTLYNKMRSITSDHSISSGKPGVIASALGRNSYARHMLVRHAHQGVCGTSHKSYGSKMEYMIVSNKHDEVNTRHRKLNAKRRATALRGKYEKQQAKMKTDSGRSFFAGRLMVRKITDYNDNMEPVVDAKEAIAFFKSTLGVTIDRIEAGEEYSETIENIIEVNTRNVRDAHDPIAFAEGVNIEAHYVVKDAEVAKNTTYAIPPYDDSVRGEAKTRWVTLSFSEPAEEESKSTGMEDAIAAIMKSMTEPKEDTVDIVQMMTAEDSSDDDDDHFQIT